MIQWEVLWSTQPVRLELALHYVCMEVVMKSGLLILEVMLVSRLSSVVRSKGFIVGWYSMCCIGHTVHRLSGHGIFNLSAASLLSPPTDVKHQNPEMYRGCYIMSQNKGHWKICIIYLFIYIISLHIGRRASLCTSLCDSMTYIINI